MPCQTQTTHTVVQGDSFAYDYTSADFPVFDGNWSGVWSIVDKLLPGSVTKANGVLSISQDQKALELRIKPSDTAFDPGQYLLIVQATNGTINFNQEIAQDIFVLKAQGVV